MTCVEIHQCVGCDDAGVLAKLRRRRPPPQIVLRSAIFLIRKGASRPPAGSAARARRERARGPWGRQYYEVPSRWRRRGPVDAGARRGGTNFFHTST